MNAPRTRKVWLINANGDPTHHVYSHSKRESRYDGGIVMGTAHYYRCIMTGVLRVWGFSYE